jgi:hypothetical protein
MNRGLFYLALVAFCVHIHAEVPNASDPLPQPEQLKQRVIATEKASAAERERYSCYVQEQLDRLNGDGGLEHRQSKASESFYVNGQQIDHLLKKDGKPLGGSAEKKEQERVAKEIKKYSDPKQVRKAVDESEKQFEMVLRALRYTNGRRESRYGRSTVTYELSGDPSFHPHSLQERFVKALAGRIWIDEKSGEVVELHVKTDRDVKIAGGVFANVHKGFEFHLLQERQPDGVWITNLVEGTGDARAALFFHPRFRFKETTANCRLYSVDATTGSMKVKDAQ